MRSRCRGRRCVPSSISLMSDARPGPTPIFSDFSRKLDSPTCHLLLDLSRGRIDLRKVKIQMRGRQVVVLVRLDLDGDNSSPLPSDPLSPYDYSVARRTENTPAKPLPTGNWLQSNPHTSTYALPIAVGQMTDNLGLLSPGRAALRTVGTIVKLSTHCVSRTRRCVTLASS